MPYQVEWAPEPHILLTTVTGTFDAEQIEEWLKTEAKMMESAATDTVHCTIDLRQMERLTANILKMPIVVEFAQHPKLGWSVIVGTRPIVGFWLELLSRVTPVRYKVQPTIEDSSDFLLALVQIAEERRSGLYG